MRLRHRVCVATIGQNPGNNNLAGSRDSAPVIFLATEVASNLRQWHLQLGFHGINRPINHCPLDHTYRARKHGA
jgi:hypothetical protein